MRKNQVLGCVYLFISLLITVACGLNLGVPFDGDAEKDAASNFQEAASPEEGGTDALHEEASRPPDGGRQDGTVTNDAEPDAVSLDDAQTADVEAATPPPPFPTCALALDGGASLVDVEVQGGDSLGALFFIPRAIPADPDIRDYVTTNHIFRLLRAGSRLPAFVVASGRGRAEISFDPRLGKQPIYSAVANTAQVNIGLCAVNVQGDACLTNLLTALRCEVVKDVTSGCPPAIGFTALGRKQSHSVIAAGQDVLLFGIITCP
jgi:hypothetical protein